MTEVFKTEELVIEKRLMALLKKQSGKEGLKPIDIAKKLRIDQTEAEAVLIRLQSQGRVKQSGQLVSPKGNPLLAKRWLPV